MAYKKLNRNRKVQDIHFTIEDFNSKGEIAKFKIPTFTNAIEPNYTEHAALQCRTKKFRMKTDILKLREIVRKKFIIYAGQQICLENQQKIIKQNETYNKLNENTAFIAEHLDQIESNAFKETRIIQKQLESLQQSQIGDELETLLAYHQCIMLEVHELCDRLNFLLKIISYIDIIIYPNVNVTIEAIERKEYHEPDAPCSNQNSELNRDEEKPIEEIQSLHLCDTKSLNADLWIQGYESIKQKIFNFHQSLTDVAKLHHFLYQMNESTEECLAKHTELILLNNTNTLKKRTLYLKQRSIDVMDKLEKKHKIDNLNVVLNALVPVIWEKILKRIDEYHHHNEIGVISKGIHHNINTEYGILTMVEEMQWHLMEIFKIIEQIPQEKYRRFEKYLRKRINMQKNASRKAFIEQHRLHNLILHYKKHNYLQRKNFNWNWK